MKCRLGMKKCTGCLFAGSVHGGCVCNNWGGVDHRSGVDNGVGNSNGGSGGGERSSTVVGDLSDVAVDRVRVVVHVLDSAIRKGNRIGALSVTGTIAALSGVEVGVGVVVSDGVLVGVGRDLIGVHLSNSVGNRGMISRGSVDNGGVISWSSVDHRGSMVCGGSVDHRGGMVCWGNSVCNRVGNGVGNRVGKAMSDDSVVGKAVSNNSMVGKAMSNNTVRNSVTNNCVANTMMDTMDGTLTKVGGNTMGGSVGN